MSSGFGQQRSWHGCTPHHVSRTTSHHASAERMGSMLPWGRPGHGLLAQLWPSSPAALPLLYPRRVYTRSSTATLAARLRALYPSILASSPRRMRPLSPTRAALLPPALLSPWLMRTPLVSPAPLSPSAAGVTRIYMHMAVKPAPTPPTPTSNTSWTSFCESRHICEAIGAELTGLQMSACEP